MNRTILFVIALATGLGAGAAIDHSVLQSPASGTVAAVSTDVSPPSVTAAEMTPGVTAVNSSQPDLATMRAMVREELAMAFAKAQAVNQTARVAAAVQAPAPVASPQQQRDALQAVDTMISSGRWGNEERNTFRQKIAMLDPQQREQAMQRLVQAIDSGGVKVATIGSMF